jgi:tetratricopeptide (TPR) repeat protein
MYVDIWAWMRDFERQASEQNDSQRLAIVNGYYDGWRCINSGQNDTALNHFEKALTLARSLNEHCWDLFLDSNCAEIFIFKKAESKIGLDRTIRLATRVYRPEAEECPVRARILCNLAYAYKDYDVFGYMDEILDLLNSIENDVPMDHDSHLRLRFLRVEIALELEQYDEAEKVVHIGLVESFGNTYRMTQSNALLSEIAYVRGDLQLALSYATEGAKYATQGNMLRAVASNLLWQAMIQRRLGNIGTAQNLLQRGLAEYQRYDLPLRESYYNHLCDFYEVAGEAEKSLALRQQQLKEVAEQTITAQSYTHLHYCRLLGRMGKPLDEALANARAVASAMKKSDLYLERLQRIVDGNYYLFDWQKV